MVQQHRQHELHKMSPLHVDFFLQNLQNFIPLQKKHQDYENMKNNGVTMEFTLTELKLSVRPSTKSENYHYFEKLWCRERMHTCQDFLWKFNKRDVVSNLEAMQKMSNFYHEKGFDMLKLRCAFPNLDKILCAQTYWCKVLSPQRERQRFVGGKSAKNKVAGLALLLTRKTVFDDTRKSSNICLSKVGVDAN